MNEYLKTGLGRWLPVMPTIVKDDPWWLDPEDPHRTAYVQQGLLGPTMPQLLRASTRPMARSSAEQRLGHGRWPTSSKDGMTPEAAVDKAFKRVEEIFAKYPIARELRRA